MINLHFSMLKHDLRWSNFLRIHTKSSGRWSPTACAPESSRATQFFRRSSRHASRFGRDAETWVTQSFFWLTLEELSPSELDLTMKTKKKNIGKLHPREKKSWWQNKNHHPPQTTKKDMNLLSNNPSLKTNRSVQNAAIMWLGWPIRHWDHWDVATNGNLTNQTQGAYQPKLVPGSCNVQRRKVHKTWKEQLKKDRHIIVVQYLYK